MEPWTVPEAVAKRAAASGPECRHWMEIISGIISKLEDEWHIRVEKPFSGGTDAFVAPAVMRDGTEKKTLADKEAILGENFSLETELGRDSWMNLRDCYVEEDLFPMIFTEYEERDYGILFYNTENRDSFDSNHAVIYKDRIHDIRQVLADIVKFYKAKGSRPIIYQSMLDDNWFDEIKDELAAAGFKSWIEDQEYMLQSHGNLIIPNPEITVKKVSEWNDEIENVFIEAEEPWEIMVAKKTLAYPKAWMFAAYLNKKPIGLLYGHMSERACRVDYLLVSKKHRKTGTGRALFYSYVEWCRQNGIENTYIWPDGDTPKRIYEEGGYSVVEVRKAGRAVLDE